MPGDVQVPEPALESEADPNAAVESLVSETMQAALKAARDRLLDRSLRNKLINTPLKSTKARQVRIYDELSDQVFARLRGKGAFTFSAGRPSGKADEDQETGSTWVPDEDPDPERHVDSKLQTQLTPEGLQKRLLSLYYEGKTLEEEQGINVLFLALGFLEWREAAKSEIERFAPLVLLPVELIRDGARDRFKLKVRDEDLITNISLQAWLKDEFGIQLPDVPETDDWSPSGYFQTVFSAIEAKAAGPQADAQGGRSRPTHQARLPDEPALGGAVPSTRGRRIRPPRDRRGEPGAPPRRSGRHRAVPSDRRRR